ncbi:MAG: AraC family transcriptional regulator [Verrucomicrobiota bacterium]|nr:AraC family transcriptional regulator [Verrucomicrobiota bacterium]
MYKTHMQDESLYITHKLQPLHVELLLMHFQDVHHWNIPDLRAPYWRLYHNTTAGAEVLCHGVRTVLKPDSIYIIPCELPFAAKAHKPFRQMYIHFLLHAQPQLICEPQLYRFKIDAEIQQWLCPLEQNQPTLAHATQLAATALVSATLARLPLVPSPETALSPRLHRAMQRITQSVGVGISNDELARVAAMNTNAFIRAFREATGKTPQVCLTEARIREACLRLHHSHDSIDTIAADCGYCDRYHFTRVFKQYRGLPPAIFRQQAIGH